MKKRYFLFDFFKAISLLLMIYINIFSHLLIDVDYGTLRYPEFQSIFVLMKTIFFASFVYILPVSIGFIFYQSVIKTKVSFKSLGVMLVKLLCLGYGINVLTEGVYSGLIWEDFILLDILAWGIFQFSALCMLVTYLVFKVLPARWSRQGVILLGLATVFFSNVFPFKDFSHLYGYQIVFGDVMGRFFWPFCPWFSLFALGVLFSTNYPFKRKSDYIAPALLGFFVLLIYVVFLLSFKVDSEIFFRGQSSYDQSWGEAFFKPSLFYVFGVLGAITLIICFFDYCFKQFSSFRKFVQQSVLMPFGQGAVWVFFVTTIVIYHLCVLTMLVFSPSAIQVLFLVSGYYVLIITLGYFIGRSVGAYKKIEYFEDSFSSE